MEVRKATENDLSNTQNWCLQSGRVEEMTCRPVKDGKKLPNPAEKYTLICFLDGFDQPIGKFSYFDLNTRNRSCEFGYVVNPKYRGKKLGTQMISECITYLFNDRDLNLNKLYCQTAEFNIPSVKILEKLNLTRDGVLREHHELDGKLYDDYIYSILRSEWEK